MNISWGNMNENVKIYHIEILRKVLEQKNAEDHRLHTSPFVIYNFRDNNQKCH